ncbi:MAG: hypothetical protein ACOYEP_11615 [Limnochordia bacterium]|jgi:hypothetical protein
MADHRLPQAPLWTADRRNRLIEMFRARNTVEEIARELSLPIDEIEARLEDLALEEYDLPFYD